ncbi:MAG: glutamyl-tRNA reductase [Candidatus Dormiibacterota bacterium]
MRLVAAGLSFRTAPLAAREAAAIPAARAATTLRYLVGHAGLHGAAVLSTCNRTDFYVVCPDNLSAEVTPRLARYLDPGGTHEVERHMVTLEDREAAMHMFRVASGLESMVIGEAQVLGQFKAAHRVATDAGTVDARLDYVMRRAISAAKRVRTETSLGRGAASLSEVAVECARASCGDLEGKGVLLVGAGKMSRLAANRLRDQGARIMTTSRGVSSRRLARAVGAEPVALAGLEEVARDVDVIIASTDSPTTVLDAAAIDALQRRREQRPLCIVDMAVPRDIDAEAAEVPGVTLIDIDELGRRAGARLDERRATIPAVEQIIDTELDKTVTVIGQRDTAGPTIAALVEWAERLRAREVARTFGAGGEIDDETRERVDRLTRSMVRKLLHGPVTRLRDAGDPATTLAIREAFRLDR